MHASAYRAPVFATAWGVDAGANLTHSEQSVGQECGAGLQLVSTVSVPVNLYTWAGGHRYAWTQT